MVSRQRSNARPHPIPSGAAEGTQLGDRLTTALERLPGLDARSWREALEPLDLHELSQHLRFSPAGYSRILLARTNEAEALLMGWLPGQVSAIHDHGVSRGVSVILAGSAVEDVYEARDGHAVKTSSRTWSRGDMLFERPGDVHRIANPGPELLVTFHAYAPRLTEFRKYET